MVRTQTFKVTILCDSIFLSFLSTSVIFLFKLFFSICPRVHYTFKIIQVCFHITLYYFIGESVLVTQLCLTLCDPLDCSPPGSSVHEILQARILEWEAILFSRGSTQPRNWTWVFCIVGRFFTIWNTREALDGQYFNNSKRDPNSSLNLLVNLYPCEHQQYFSVSPSLVWPYS